MLHIYVYDCVSGLLDLEQHAIDSSVTFATAHASACVHCFPYKALDHSQKIISSQAHLH